MARFDSFTAGQFSWVDLMSPDPQASTRFYSGLFGWSSDATQDDAGGAYSMFDLGGISVAGMGTMPEEMKTAGAPPTWSSYVTVEDVDASAARAQELGGKLQMPAMDIKQEGSLVGRMAVLVDPEGAYFSLWQAGSHPGAGATNEPSTFGWNELLSRDVEAAKQFYGGLFGWTFKDSGGYQEILVGERMNGGILPWRPEMGEMPAYWAVYFNVADCDKAVEKITELGGTVLVPATDIEPGRFAVVADPQGAAFNVMCMKNPD